MPIKSGAAAVLEDCRAAAVETVPEMRVVHLNLIDLDERIRGYEIQYRVSTVDMLSNPAVRDRIPEDDLLEWEAYVNHRISLREYYDRIHREYLQEVHPMNHRAKDDPTEYAA